MCAEVEEARTKGSSLGYQELDLYIYISTESSSLEKGDANMKMKVLAFPYRFELDIWI